MVQLLVRPPPIFPYSSNWADHNLSSRYCSEHHPNSHSHGSVTSKSNTHIHMVQFLLRPPPTLPWSSYWSDHQTHSYGPVCQSELTGPSLLVNTSQHPVIGTLGALLVVGWELLCSQYQYQATCQLWGKYHNQSWMFHVFSSLVVIFRWWVAHLSSLICADVRMFVKKI